VVHPAEGDARPLGRRAVGPHVVPDIEGLPRRQPERVERVLEDARIGLGEAAPLGRDDDREQALEARRAEARALDVVDAVGDDAEPVPPAEPLQGRPAAGESVPALRELQEERMGQLGGTPRAFAQVGKEEAEALAGQVGLRDLAPPVLLPQDVVEASVLHEDRGREGQPEVRQGCPQGRALGAVEVQERVVEVEKDGSRPSQGEPTWRDR